MSSRKITCAVISTDRGFIDALGSTPPFESGSFSLDAEIGKAYPDITDVDLQELRAVEPDIVILDLEKSVAIGLKFAEFLGEAGIGEMILAAAPAQSPELLMDVMHAGISDFIPKPPSPEATDKALKSARRKLGKSEAVEHRSPGEVMVFFSAKGGTGCTTVCANTSVEVHRSSRKKTLLVDLDLELGETALQLGEEPRFNMVDLVRNFHRVDTDLLASYIEHHESGVDLLSAPHKPAAFEALSGDRVTEIMGFLALQYDYILVDAPKTLNPALNPATIAAMKGASQLYLVTTLDLPSIRNLARCLPLLKDLGEDKADDWIRIVVNRYDSKELISLSQLEETAGHPVFATVRNDYQVVMNAINEGRPAVMSGSSNFAQDIRKLAGEITGVEPEQKGGWLGGLLRSVRIGRGKTRVASTGVTNE